MKKYYVRHLRPIGRFSEDQFEPILWSAMMVYLVLTIGIVNFVLPQTADETSLLVNFGWGALFGFVVYATYDFTNYSTLKDWSLNLTFIDILWGSFLSGISTVILVYFL